MKRMAFPLQILLVTGLLGVIIAATGQQPKSPATLLGKWEWVSTQVNGENPLFPASIRETITLVYNPDSTVDQYRNGVLVGKGRPFSVRRTAHPSGSGVIDVMVCPDETGFTEPYQTVWLKGAQSDTLVFMGLNPDNGFRPMVYSVYKRVGK
ncbi:MAG: hypothetical protein AVDCRST_MAG56-7570 [uncultured Cytophagales bacterium]|uniref:Uncharacterized protein n=1 Tax=uncultured Cytophagales bacterium TaxID=158755 RepID=A0A6J4LJW5_9SPHI|nr:MAG: hypothetical protein AVDCRST_MAG56-7570 [uncultured Cytophagales bacterium]